MITGIGRTVGEHAMDAAKLVTALVTCTAIFVFLALAGLEVVGRDIPGALGLSLAVAAVACICYVMIGLAAIIIRKVEANGRRILAQTAEIKRAREELERITSHMRAMEYIPGKATPAVEFPDLKAS